MLTTVPIEELQSGDLLPDGIGAPLDEGERNARILIRDAMAVPTHGASLYERARTVREVLKVGRMYVSVTMGTYAVVRLRKGSLVSVYRNGGNEPQNVSPAVLDAAEPVPADLDSPEQWLTPKVVAACKWDTPYGPERQPFNYVRSQFGKLGAVENAGTYKIQIWGENGNHTKWLSVHPDDLAALQRLMEARENNS